MSTRHIRRCHCQYQARIQGAGGALSDARTAPYILAAYMENATNRTKDKEVLGDAR
jgi:hypothetical protein